MNFLFKSSKRKLGDKLKCRVLAFVLADGLYGIIVVTKKASIH
jgi:hypothetical protein